MTVNELIAELQKLPGEYLVLLSSDAEGNEKNELADLGESWAFKFSRDGWETYTDEDVEADEDDEDQEPFVKVVVLWPV